MSNKPLKCTYEAIQLEAEQFASDYRDKIGLPKLPDEKSLQPYKQIIEQRYPEVVKLIKVRLAQVESDPGHGFEHLEWVACLAGYIADIETEGKNHKEKKEIISKAILTGLLHDIERHMGWGEPHTIAGEKTSRELLSKLNLVDEDVLTAIRHHDDMNYDFGGNETLRIIYGSVFDADHFRYGLERADTFWNMKQKRGVLPQEVIHDYAFLPPFRNTWKTKYGKIVGPQFVDYGMAIAKHIEDKFSNG